MTTKMVFHGSDIEKISGLNIPKKTDAEVWILCSAD